VKPSTAKLPARVPKRFLPRFWENADQRQVAIREIKRRYALLRKDAGADSFQRDLLAQRAIFISVQLETMEVEASEGGDFNSGHYTQMVNALTGLLKALGLEKRATAQPWLEPAKD
jgi:hypothetical protein